MKRIVSLLALIVLVSAAVPVARGAIPATPFAAWHSDRTTTIYEEPDDASRRVGRLRWGDSVTVVRCVPDCSDERAWAELEPYGFVRLSTVRPVPVDPIADERSAYARFRYARAGSRGATTHARPDESSTVLGRHRDGDGLALVPDGWRDVPGWASRAGGGYVSMSEIRVYTPSVFQGEHDPAGPVVFVVRSTELRAPDGTVTTVARYDRFPLLGSAPENRVRVPGGTISRNHVRVARPRTRPSGVGHQAKWVHVDLAQQVLTAYEGDRMVFATLISSGKDEHRTKVGRYRVFLKTVHEDMHGDPSDPFIVEEVPWIMYFNREQALHGAYWHDHFGTRLSHGCVNLSPIDARFLYGWAPPEVPNGWHALYAPRAPASASLFVQVVAH